MDHLLVYLTSETTQVQLDEHHMSLPHVFCQIFSFCFNFPNVLAEYQNNVLYLSPTLFITLPDGLYTQNSMNNRVLLTAQADTKFYGIFPATNGMNYDIYQFNSYSDKVNMLNPTVMTGVVNLSIANKELYNGVWFMDRIKLRTEAFEVHANDPLYARNGQLSLCNEIIIPITVEPLQCQAYHFNSKYGFHNKNCATISFKLLDMKNRLIKIDPDNINYPILSLRYEEADY